MFTRPITECPPLILLQAYKKGCFQSGWHFSSAVHPVCDPTMSTFCNLAALMLLLTFQSPVHAGKIIGGHEVNPHKHSYMVFLRLVSKADELKGCGGFLIREDFVMTAAHCQAKAHGSYEVFYGFDKHSENHKKVSVKKDFPHVHYNESDYTNDIMLLKLSHNVSSAHNIKHIEPAKEESSSLPNPCSVCGWELQSSTKLPSKLLKVNVVLVENQDCVKESAYCSEGKTGTSGGDSGGPLICNGMAYGVVSASKPIDGSTLYKYTNVPDTIDWINNILKDN
ncbi:mast cell protease 1A-like isoform X2 [Gambusia affinis]|uniref:mast cell protease 1A-like isoform X2 n=1 Tax=Gambusia affinis TaxID=33528 RepID=UPI001CDCF16F|nr:mast cell protease 1A-like isoform X2 [Gambusia affinis]